MRKTRGTILICSLEKNIDVTLKKDEKNERNHFDIQFGK